MIKFVFCFYSSIGGGDYQGVVRTCIYDILQFLKWDNKVNGGDI